MREQKLYALKCPDGDIDEQTIAPSLTECWGRAFDVVASREGLEWQRKYWKKWDESKRDARRRGYIMVLVEIAEIKKKKTKT
jgi:hypothetical protein